MNKPRFTKVIAQENLLANITNFNKDEPTIVNIMMHKQDRPAKLKRSTNKILNEFPYALT